MNNSDLIKCYQKIDEIVKLKDNWNNNGARAILPIIGERAKKIVNKLEEVPDIYPTGTGTIEITLGDYNLSKPGSSRMTIEVKENTVSMYTDIGSRDLKGNLLNIIISEFEKNREGKA